MEKSFSRDVSSHQKFNKDRLHPDCGADMSNDKKCKIVCEEGKKVKYCVDRKGNLTRQEIGEC